MGSSRALESEYCMLSGSGQQAINILYQDASFAPTIDAKKSRVTRRCRARDRPSRKEYTQHEVTRAGRQVVRREKVKSEEGMDDARGG